jgi:hypothetical protein
MEDNDDDDDDADDTVAAKEDVADDWPSEINLSAIGHVSYSSSSPSSKFLYCIYSKSFAKLYGLYALACSIENRGSVL